MSNTAEILIAYHYDTLGTKVAQKGPVCNEVMSSPTLRAVLVLSGVSQSSPFHEPAKEPANSEISISHSTLLLLWISASAEVADLVIRPTRAWKERSLPCAMDVHD